MSATYDIKKLIAEGVQPLLDLTPEQFAELKLSIETIGMLEPIKLTADGSMMWDGHQRCMALLAMGRTRITAKDVRLVRGVTRANAEDHALATNVIRRHMTPAGMAQAMHKLAARGWSQTRIAKAFSKSQGRVSQLMSEFPPGADIEPSAVTHGADGKEYTRGWGQRRRKPKPEPKDDGVWSEPKAPRDTVHPWASGGDVGKALRKMRSAMAGWSPDTVHKELTPREWSETITLINETIDAATRWVQEPTK